MPQRFKHRFLPTFAMISGDAACIAAVYYWAAVCTRLAGGQPEITVSGRLPYLGILLVLWYGAAIHQRLYLPGRSDDLLPLLASATKAVMNTLVVGVFYLAVFSSHPVDREFVFTFGIGMFAVIVSFRAILRFSLWGLRLRGYNAHHILVIGANERTSRLVELIVGHHKYGYTITGFLEDDPERADFVTRYNVPYLGPVDKLEELLVNRVIDEIYVTLPIRSFYETVLEVVHLCESVGVPVRLIAGQLPFSGNGHYFWRLVNIPLLSMPHTPGLQLRIITRRLSDWLVSSVLLLALSPLFFVIAILIKLESKGPIFMRDPRLNCHGRVSYLRRFRCVRMDTDGTKPTDEVTRTGRLLIRYGLDELPYLINAWLGQLELMGPKPPSLYKVNGILQTGRSPSAKRCKE